MPPPASRTRWILAVVALLGPGPVEATARGQADAEGLSARFRAAARRVLPAVVTVRPLGVPDPFDPAPPMPFGVAPPRPVPREANGSGLVIDAARGLVLTNDHVIQGASRVVVILGNGRERPVLKSWRDPKSDLALLSVEPSGLVQAEWGDSDATDIGDWVLAVGQPFGLSGTVTAGIISGKGRGIGIALYEDLIQTDAAINPGNSGGPLVNLKGEVVGINAAIKTLGGGYEGVGFAVPASRARRVAADLAEFGRVRRAYLGVTIRPVDPATAERLGSATSAMVTGIAAASPAETAGLRPGDVILKVGGQPVAGPGPLQSLIEVAPVGEILALTVERSGQVLEIPVRPEPQPDRLSVPGPGAGGGIEINVPGAKINVPGPRIMEEESPLNPTPPPARNRPPTPDGPQEAAARLPTRFPELGLRLSEPSPALIRRFRFEKEPRGLVVIGVEPGGPADRGGLEIGMVLTDSAGRKVTSLPEFRESLAHRPEGRDLLVRILKGSKAEFRVIVDRSPAGRPEAEEPTQLEPIPDPDPKASPPAVRPD